MTDDRRFAAPRLTIDRVYTRSGDSGETALAGGRRVAKDDPRVEAYGTVDELNALVGLARVEIATLVEAFPRLSQLGAILLRVQHELFNLGSVLATVPERVREDQAQVRRDTVERLEHEIDACNVDLPALRSFVLPGGSCVSAKLHHARTVCRRAERLCVALSRREAVSADSLAYLNRLSDALFVWGRWADALQGLEETLWDPNV